MKLFEECNASDTFEDGWEAAAQYAENTARVIRSLVKKWPGSSELAVVRAEALEELVRGLRRKKINP